MNLRLCATTCLMLMSAQAVATVTYDRTYVQSRTVSSNGTQNVNDSHGGFFDPMPVGTFGFTSRASSVSPTASAGGAGSTFATFDDPSAGSVFYSHTNSVSRTTSTGNPSSYGSNVFSYQFSSDAAFSVSFNWEVTSFTNDQFGPGVRFALLSDAGNTLFSRTVMSGDGMAKRGGFGPGDYRLEISHDRNTAAVIFGSTVNSPNESISVSSSFAILAATVPEPASWAMMIVGFGLVGASARRRPAVPVTA